MRNIILASLIISVSIFSGCSNPPEEMSTVRANLILDIFKLIKQDRHEEAYIKIKKLRELDPTNTHLPILEEVEKNNAELQKLNNLFKNNQNQEEMIILINNLIKNQGNIESKEAIAAAEKLKDVLRLNQLADTIIHPKPSFEKNKPFKPASKVQQDAINEFIRISQKWNISPTLRNKVIGRMENASKLRKEEEERYAQSLELLAYGLRENSFQTMMALSLHVK